MENKVFSVVRMVAYTGKRETISRNGAKHWVKCVLYAAPHGRDPFTGELNKQPTLSATQPISMWIDDTVAIDQLLALCLAKGKIVAGDADKNVGYEIDKDDIPVELKYAYSDLEMIPTWEIIKFDGPRYLVDKDGKPVLKDGKIVKAERTTISYWTGSLIAPKYGRDAAIERCKKEWRETVILSDDDDQNNDDDDQNGQDVEKVNQD